MAKFCANGHQMEDTWTICPYCQKTGYQAPAAPPMKTRLESEPAAAPRQSAAQQAAKQCCSPISENRPWWAGSWP